MLNFHFRHEFEFAEDLRLVYIIQYPLWRMLVPMVAEFIAILFAYCPMWVLTNIIIIIIIIMLS